MKTCTICKVEKDESCFSFKNKIKNKLKSGCKDCEKIYHKEYRNKNKKQISKNQKEYDQKNKENKREYNKKNRDKILKNKIKYYQENKEKISKNNKEYRIKNKEQILKRNKKYNKERSKIDPVFRLRRNATVSANKGLKNHNSSKNNQSFFKFMGFTGQKLMDHLMNHSDKEWWMNENNQGIYRLDKWDDNDPSTWTWQLDHIIPHSTFNYTSMDDPEFKRCWALENLRPLSAKQNVLDGVNRIRHDTKIH